MKLRAVFLAFWIMIWALPLSAVYISQDLVIEHQVGHKFFQTPGLSLKVPPPTNIVDVHAPELLLPGVQCRTRNTDLAAQFFALFAALKPLQYSHELLVSESLLHALSLSELPGYNLE